uniref:MFS transporter n=1 Tax=Eiseniibacteriota bacterium TaxID=2212470 RepID=A0A832MM33_UNCEI
MRPVPARLALVTAGHFTIDAYSSFFTPLLPLLMARLGLGLTEVGALVAIASVGTSFSQPLFGLLSDRLRRPWFVAAGPLVAALFMSAVGAAPSYPALVALLLAGGAGVAAFHPQAAALAREVSPRPQIGMSIFVTGGTLGFALGPLFAAATAERFGLERTWLAALPGLVVGGLLFARFVTLAPAAHEAAPRAPLRALRPVIVPLALLYTAVVCRSAVSYGFMTFLPIHLHAAGYGVQAGGALTTLYLAAGALGGVLGGWAAERHGGRAVVRLSFLGAMPLYAAFVLVPGAPGLAGLVLGSFVLQTSLPVNVVLGQELSPRHASTIASLLMGAAWGVGALLIGPTGALADRAGLPAALAALAGLLVVGLACGLALPEARRPAAAPGAGPRAAGAAGE